MRTSVVGWRVIASVVAALLLVGAAFAQGEAGVEGGVASPDDASHCYLAAEAVEVGPERLLADAAPCSVEDSEAPAEAEATAVAPATGGAYTVTP